VQKKKKEKKAKNDFPKKKNLFERKKRTGKLSSGFKVLFAMSRAGTRRQDSFFFSPSFP
jgi:hypothetical protein